jgi:hypothetical protein
MAFNLKEARAAGYSDAEIADYLSQQKGFDVKAARAAGYRDDEIIAHLVGLEVEEERPLNRLKSAASSAIDVIRNGLSSVNFDPVAVAQQREIEKSRSVMSSADGLQPSPPVDNPLVPQPSAESAMQQVVAKPPVLDPDIAAERERMAVEDYKQRGWVDEEGKTTGTGMVAKTIAERGTGLGQSMAFTGMPGTDEASLQRNEEIAKQLEARKPSDDTLGTAAYSMTNGEFDRALDYLKQNAAAGAVDATISTLGVFLKPLRTPIVMAQGASEGGNAYRDSVEAGMSEEAALGRAAFQALSASLTEMVGFAGADYLLGKLTKMTPKAQESLVKKAMASAGKAAGTAGAISFDEGAEEVINSIANDLADKYGFSRLEMSEDARARMQNPDILGNASESFVAGAMGGAVSSPIAAAGSVNQDVQVLNAEKAVNYTLNTDQHQKLDDDELQQLRTVAEVVNREKPGAVDIAKVDAEIARRANLPTMTKAAEAAQRSIERSAPEALDAADILGDENADQLEGNAAVDTAPAEAGGNLGEGSVADLALQPGRGESGNAAAQPVPGSDAGQLSGDGVPEDTALASQTEGSNSVESQIPPENEVNAHAAATSPINDLPEPTDAQKEAGNYKKGAIKVGGLNISVENPEGSVRRSKADAVDKWETTMTAHYGYIKGVKARAPDKEHVDVYVKPGTAEDYSGDVYVVNQIDPKTGKFDEVKAMIGYSSREEAEAGYRSNYTPDWRGMGSIAAVPMSRFKEMLQDEKAFLKPVEESKPEPAQQQASTETGAPAPAGKSSAGRPELRPLIEALIKRRAAANQVGKSRQLQNMLDKAKAAMNGEDIKPAVFKNGAVHFNRVDEETRKLLLDIHDALKNAPDPAEEERKAKLQFERAERARKMLAERNKLNPQTDDLLTAIAKLGGVKKDEAIAEFGFDPADLGRFHSGIKPTFSNGKNALTIDGMREALRQFGYPVGDTVRDFGDILDAAIRGEEVQADEGVERDIQARIEAYEEQFIVQPDAVHELADDLDDWLDNTGTLMTDDEVEALLNGNTEDRRAGQGVDRQDQQTSSGATQGSDRNDQAASADQAPAAEGQDLLGDNNAELPILTGKTAFSDDKYGASIGSVSEGNRRQLMVDPDGGFYWGDWRQESQRDTGAVSGGKDKDGEVAYFASSKEAREAAKNTPQSKTSPSGSKEAPAGINETQQKAIDRVRKSQQDLFGDNTSGVQRAKPAEEKQAKATEGAQPGKPAPESPKEEAEQAIQPKQTAESVSPLDIHDRLFERIYEGKASADEFHKAYDSLLKNKDAIIAELSSMTKAQLFERYPGLQWRYKYDKKDEVVNAAFRRMQDDFSLNNSISYSFGDKYDDVIRRIVERTDDAALEAFAEEVKAEAAKRKAERAERRAGMENPQTLDDFNNLLRSKMDEGMSLAEARKTLTPEQRERYDDMAAMKTRGERAARKIAQKTEVQAAVRTTSGDIIETKHTKTGEDLFVVKAAERVEREVYNQWNATAKRLGGWYSSYRGNGAVPGFQFKTRESAEAFLKYLGGEVDEAKEALQARRNAFEDDRSQTAAQRLTEMAEKLEGRANESLSSERKVNTARRARIAASAEAAANADKALAKTMRNIAEGIESGNIKYLDQVRQKVQVEMLQGMVRTAHDDMLREKYPAYSDQEKHRGEPPTKEVADYVNFPSYTAFRSDLANLGRALLEQEGMKKIGQRIMSVADDVTDAYLKFARENLLQVSRFTVKDSGGPPIFSSKQEAESAIARSGFKGRAIVLPFKRGENIIILSPSEAMKLGIWQGDPDKRITLAADLGAEIVEKLGKINRNRNVISVPWQFENAYDKRKRLSAMGIETPAELRAAIREFVSLHETPKAPDRVKELERAMIGRRNDGLDFFPTPASIADQMIETADIQEGMSVLEPSAGMGHIADRIREAGVEPDVVELSGERRELLEAKGYNLVGYDFMDLNEGEYDRIIMNPPFGDRRDSAHVQHAYELLKPGGRLVAIMGEGVFFGQDKRAQEFREWLERVGGTDEKLEEGTFNDPSLPVTTGVNARMVVIDKAKDAPAFSRGGAGPQRVLFKPQAHEGYRRKLAEHIAMFKSGDKRKFRAAGNDPVLIGRTPVVLRQVMEEDGSKPFKRTDALVGQGSTLYLKATNTHSTSLHSGEISIDVLNRLPELLADPVAVFKSSPSSEDAKSFKVLIDAADENGNPVIVAVRPAMTMQQLNDERVNFQATIFPTTWKQIRAWNKDGLLRYYNDKSPRTSKPGSNPLGAGASADAHTGEGFDATIGVAASKVKVMTRSEIEGLPPAAWSRGAGRGMSPELVQMAVDRLKAKWENAPEIIVVNDMNDSRIRKAVRDENDRQLSQGATGQPEGFFDAGKVYIVASEMNSASDVQRVLFHEALGHYGLRGVFGNALDQVLDEIYMTRRIYVLEKAKDYGLDFTKQSDRRIAAEEVLAEMAQNNPQLGFVQRAIAAIRSWLRKMGFDIKMTDAEIIREFIEPARAFVQRGNQERDVADLVAAFDRGEADQTETEAFKRWFGDSKVVDADGKPLVVYHGTDADFGAFDLGRAGAVGERFAEAAFFTSDPDVAGSYAARWMNNQNFRDARAAEDAALRDWGRAVVDFGRDSPQAKKAEAEKDARAEKRRRIADEIDTMQRPSDGANIVPAYLSVQNPLEVDGKGRNFRAVYEDAFAEAEAGGHDGIIFRNVVDAGNTTASRPADVFVAFRPEQIKSAIGNRGTFDPENPNILFSRSGSTYWEGPEESKLDNLIYTLQDKNIDLKRVTARIQDVAGQLEDRWDAYLQEELYHGRAAKRTKDFINDELEPLIEDMRQRGVSMTDFEQYLWARHAEERNIQIAKINPDLPDGGSGLTTQEARDYLASLTPADRKNYEALAARVDAITRKSRQILIDYGLESAETIKAWDDAYKNYVPLMREDMEHGFGLGTGQGFSVKGSASKRATGSTRKVVDILANIAQQRERNIIRGEKNRVATALIGLAKLNPNPDFWKTDTVPKIRTVTPGKTVYEVHYHGNKVNEFSSKAAANKFIEYEGKEGLEIKKVDVPELVEDRPDPNYKNRPNVIVARIVDKKGNVVEHSVIFDEHDARAMRMAASLKNLDQDQIGELLGTASTITRYFASINTQYNPIFGIINILRDSQGAVLNLTSTELAGKQKEVIAATFPAMRGIYKDVRGRRKKATAADNEWARLWEEFQKEGGQTGYRDMFRNARERAEKMERALDPTWWQKRTWGKVISARGLLAAPEQWLVSKPGKAVFDWLSDYNETLENAVRLAAYKVGLDNGMSKQRAASLAKNLTVNFNRKGEMGRQIGALYAFFNASVQGTARIFETLAGPAGKRILAGGLLLGVMQAVALALAGFDDDEPPDFERDRNLIIPIGDGKYVKIAMPLGFNAIPAFGRIATEWALDGFTKGPQRMVHVIDMLMDVTNPIGNAGFSMQTLAPTALDPIAALTENKDWTGRQIARQDMSSLNPTPGHTRAKDTASAFGKSISYAINWLTGGTDFKPGAISPTPDQIDYLIGQISGGVGREYLKAEQTLTSAVTGENLPPHKIPLFGRFYGDTKGQSSQASEFYNNLRELNEHENEIKGRRKAGESVVEYRREHPETGLIQYGNLVERQVQALRRRKRELVAKGAPKEQIVKVDEQITTLMTRLNERMAKKKSSE